MVILITLIATSVLEILSTWAAIIGFKVAGTFSVQKGLG